MVSLDIMDSDAFLDLPLSAQMLYIHLLMRADDDGVVSNPRTIRRMVGASDDDVRELTHKKFVLFFDSYGVCVIKHWWMHQTIRSERYSPSPYQDVVAQLSRKENRAYTCHPDVTQTGDTVTHHDSQYKRREEKENTCSGRRSQERTTQAKKQSSSKKSGGRMQKKKYDDARKEDLGDFCERMRQSETRRLHILADYAEERGTNFTTVGQWEAFIDRNIRAARTLEPYDDEQISRAMKRVKKAIEQGYLTKWTLETVTKYLD
jgi:hypothetical protein